MSAGVAATGVGQLALAWIHREQEVERVRIEVRRQGVARRWDRARELDQAMERAREEIEMEDDLAEMWADQQDEERDEATVGPRMTPEELDKLFALFRVDDQGGRGANVGGGDVG